MSTKNFRNFSLVIILVSMFLAFGLPLFHLQANGVEETSGIENPLKADSFTELFIGIANWAAGIATTLAVLMVIIGGFQYMISGGNEEKTKEARRTIQWSLIGLIIILASWSLLKELLQILGVG